MSPKMRELITTYLQGPAELRRHVAGMTREQLLLRPVPGKWSTLEVVVHISDFEPILADRVKRTIALAEPSLLAADENEFLKSLAYHDRDLEEELQLIEVTRSQLARILSRLPDSALARRGIHSIKGPKTIEDLMGLAIGHIAGHLPHINDKRQSLGLAPVSS